MAEKSESNLESSSSLDDEDDFILLEEETKIRDNVEVLPVGRSSMTQKFHSAYGRPTLKRLRTSSFFDPFVGFGEAPSHRLSDPYNEIEFDISPGLMTSFSKLFIYIYIYINSTNESFEAGKIKGCELIQ